MNLIPLVAVFLLGSYFWWRSGVLPNKRYFWVGLLIMLTVWWGIWGQLALYDHWWSYGPANVTGGFLGLVPVVDLLYFFGGMGWYLYLGHKLDLF